MSNNFVPISSPPPGEFPQDLWSTCCCGFCGLLSKYLRGSKQEAVAEAEMKVGKSNWKAATRTFPLILLVSFFLKDEGKIVNNCEWFVAAPFPYSAALNKATSWGKHPKPSRWNE